MAEIIVTIKGGKAQVRVEGAKGPACKTLTEGLEAKLGNVTHTEETREYYEEEVTHAQTSENRY